MSRHVGTGTFAELAAALDESERTQRKAAAEQFRCETERQDNIERQVNEIGDMVRALVHGVMLATGHRTHKRQWRQMRDE